MILSKIITFASNVRVKLFVILLILFTVLLLQNTSTLEVKFLVFESRMPIVILILVAALVGFFGGYFFAIRFRWRQRNVS